MNSEENPRRYEADIPNEEARGREASAPPPPPRPGGWRESGGYRAEPQYGFDPRHKNAALACFLSLMPGLGQIYLGYYQRGFMHIVVVGSTIAILAAQETHLTPLFGIFLPFFWLYNIIDAGRRAGLYNHAVQGGRAGELPVDLPESGGGSVLGGGILIGVGTLMLLHTHWGMSLRWLEDWWPVAPIAVGAWLVLKGLTRGRA